MNELENITTNITNNGTRPGGTGQDEDLWKITARCFYIVVFIVGTAGNILTCYVIITRKFMRRVIHIYTLNLALADLIVILLYIPVEIVRNENDLRWTMGRTMCKLTNFVTPTSLIASICTLVAITMDRHRGVTKPLQWRGDSKKLLKWTIPLIWLVAIACSSPLFFAATVKDYENISYCVESFSTAQMNAYWIAMFLIMVVIPLTIIIVANARMIFFMKKINGALDHIDHTNQHKQHQRMIRMVVALVLVYAICSSPQHIVFFWFSYGDLEKRKEFSKHLFKAANLLVIVQSAINPIIYGIGRKDFQGAFKNIFQCVRFRLWVSVSSAEAQSGALDTLLRNFNKIEFPSHVDRNVYDASSYRFGCQIPPNGNKKLEELRKISEARAITDTPPLIRKVDRKESLPIVERYTTKSKLSRQNNLSLPISFGISKKPLTVMKNYQKMKEKESPMNNNAPRFSQFMVDIEELPNLLESPETIV